MQCTGSYRVNAAVLWIVHICHGTRPNHDTASQQTGLKRRLEGICPVRGDLEDCTMQSAACKQKASER